MGFFDDLSSKSADVLHDLSKKTGNVTDTVRLKNKISEEEKNINSLFIQIGKTYFHLCAEDKDERFLSEVTKIKESMETIEECKKELNLLNGLKTCPICGVGSPIENSFCTSCGNRFDNNNTAQDSDKKYCRSCGKPIDKSSVFCNFCGNRVD